MVASSSNAVVECVGQFRGCFFDLARRRRIDAGAFGRGWEELSRQLARRGMGAGSRVVLAVHTGPLFPAALAAVLNLGATPLLVHGATPLPELLENARRIGAEFLLTEREGAPESGEIIAAGAEDDDYFASIALLRLAGDAAGSPATAALSGALLQATSGSTGESRIAVRPPSCSVAEAHRIADTLAMDRRDVVLTCVPMNHSYGFGIGTFAPLAAHATIVTQKVFSPRSAMRALAEHEVSIFPGVPAMLDLLLKCGERPATSPRFVASAGSPLAERTATAVRTQTQWPLHQVYGTTESGTVAIGRAVAEAPGCVGAPMRGVEVRLEPGDSVGLRVRSSSVMAGYLRCDGTLETLDDGWVETGDLARLDPDGAIHIAGRVKEIINVGGMKVVPGEVETVLAGMEGVLDVAVYAGRHHSGSDIVKAAVVPAREMSAAEVQAYCDGRLIRYKRPELVVFLPALPRSPSGKLLRRRLP